MIEEMDYQREEQAIQELREFLIQEEEVPPESAARVESVIRAEARRIATVSWTEAMTLACLILLLVSAVAPVSLSFPLLGICVLASGLYAVGARWVLRREEA